MTQQVKVVVAYDRVQVVHATAGPQGIPGPPGDPADLPPLLVAGQAGSTEGATRIQMRKGTASDWSSANPTLLEGELALETDTGKVKFGDGVTAWNALGYFSAPANVVFVQDGQPEMVLGDLWFDLSVAV